MLPVVSEELFNVIYILGGGGGGFYSSGRSSTQFGGSTGEEWVEELGITML